MFCTCMFLFNLFMCVCVCVYMGLCNAYMGDHGNQEMVADYLELELISSCERPDLSA